LGVSEQGGDSIELTIVFKKDINQQKECIPSQEMGEVVEEPQGDEEGQNDKSESDLGDINERVTFHNHGKC